MFANYFRLVTKIHPDVAEVELAKEHQDAIIVALNVAFSRLSPIETEIVKRYAGIDYEKHTLDQIAAATGYKSRERVRQIEAKAIRKLRHPLNCLELLEVLDETGLHQLSPWAQDQRKMVAALDKVRSGGVLSDDELKTLDVQQLELSVRTANTLHNMALSTLYDLIQIPEWRYLRMNNFGQKSLIELKAVIAPFGISLPTE